MTKYILTGGNERKFDHYGTQLAHEVRRTIHRPANVVSCFFATPSEFWVVKAESWRPWIEQYFGEDVVWSYVVPETLTEQLALADVVYIHGGDNALLLDEFGSYPQISTLFKDKVVIGSSAGANCLSRYFWARREQRIRKGHGIVPCSVMTHYGVTDPDIPETNWDEAETLLLAQSGDRPLRLREGHFWVIEQ